MPITPGDVLRERYKIKNFISRGGMGSIFLAEDLRLKGRLTAVKEVRLDLTLSDETLRQTRDQFLREATVLARLDHPNLPKVSDFFSEENSDFLVMDYVPGEDLRTLMLESQETGEFLEEKKVLTWANQITDALIYLHSQDPPILHRDVKPSNLKLTPTEVVKLVDFGLVKVLAAKEETLTIVQGRGTALYTPLEQYGGDTGHTDARSDVYALGATLYHLLTSSPPVEARERFLQPNVMPIPSKINENISARTDRAVMAALSLHPEERPQSAEDFRKALFGNWQANTNGGSYLPRPSFADVISSAIERRLLWVSASLLLLSLIATISGLN